MHKILTIGNSKKRPHSAPEAGAPPTKRPRRPETIDLTCSITDQAHQLITLLQHAKPEQTKQLITNHPNLFTIISRSSEMMSRIRSIPANTLILVIKESKGDLSKGFNFNFLDEETQSSLWTHIFKNATEEELSKEENLKGLFEGIPAHVTSSFYRGPMRAAMQETIGMDVKSTIYSVVRKIGISHSNLCNNVEAMAQLFPEMSEA